MTARDDQVLCGWHAMQAALRLRPEHLRRLFYAQERLADLKPLLGDLARSKVPYRCVPPEELQRIAQSHAHQGVVAIFTAPVPRHVTPEELRDLARQQRVWVALDGVGNPHNLGAIARTAAFLGAHGLLVEAGHGASINSSAAYRTAEGALDVLPVWQTQSLAAALQAVVDGGGLTVGLDHRSAMPLHALRMPPTNMRILVAGAEESGLRREVLAACRQRVRIEGTGAVESLNVGVAVAIALAQMLRA